MNWHERMNLAIDYIEENLAGEIDPRQITAIMCQSAAGFYRTFSIITDMSVTEYIRRRRLTLAAFALQSGRGKVLDVALRYGYDSPESFTRAFREQHGVTPTAARAEGAVLRSFPRISFQFTIKGVHALDYRIESREAFSVYGIEKIFSMEGGANLRDIPLFWQDCWGDGRANALIASQNGPCAGLHSLCSYENLEGGSFPYMIFAYKTTACDTAGYKEVAVPAATWAIFRTEKHTEQETADKIQALIKRVYTDWLPTAAYEKVDGCELELYLNEPDGACVCEFWIRVRKK